MLRNGKDTFRIRGDPYPYPHPHLHPKHNHNEQCHNIENHEGFWPMIVQRIRKVEKPRIDVPIIILQYWGKYAIQELRSSEPLN